MVSLHVDSQLLDAVQSTDAARRESALQRLIGLAQRFAGKRSPGHAERIAESAVAYMCRQAERGAVRFTSVGELIAYLRRVAQGKAVDPTAEDRRRVGGAGDAAMGLPDDAATAQSGQTSDSMVEVRESTRFARAWLGRFHPALRDAVASHFAGRIDPETSLANAPGGLHGEAGRLAAAIDRVLSLLPCPLRACAIQRIAAQSGRIAALDVLLSEMDLRLRASRRLSDPLHRLVVEMREAGWSLRDIAGRLGISARKVRIIHHCACIGVDSLERKRAA